jgi:hypothetical protein
VTHQYDYGKKQRVETYHYDGPSSEVISRIDIEESDVDITWASLPDSTGWPYYKNNVSSVVSGNNITVDNTDPANPVISTTGVINNVSPGDNISIDYTNPANPVISAGGFVGGVVAGSNITVDNTDPLNPIISTTGVLNSVSGGYNIYVDNMDPSNPVINFTGDIGPTISSIVPIYGDIRGGDVFKIAPNTLSVEPVSCMDSTGIVALYTSLDKLVSIPSTPINQIYHIFVVRLVSDGSIICKAYTTEAAASSDLTINAYRWLDFWFTNGSGVCRDGASKNGTHWWSRFTENMITGFMSAPAGITTPSNVSLYVPVSHVDTILMGAQNNTSNTNISFSGVSGTSMTSMVSTDPTLSLSGQSNEWGHSWYKSDFFPVIGNDIYWGNGDTVDDVNNTRLAIHAVTLRR